MSASGQKRTSTALIGQLIRSGKHRCRNFEAKRLRGFEVDDQLKFSWLLDRQVSWLGALQNLIHKVRGVAIAVGKQRSIAHQTSRLGILVMPVHGGQLVLSGKLCKAGAIKGGEGVGKDDYAVGAFTSHCLKCSFKFLGISYLQGLEGHA